MKKLFRTILNMESSFTNSFALKKTGATKLTAPTKKLLLAVFLLAFSSFSSNVNAQIVNIPDANFKAALVNNVR